MMVRGQLKPCMEREEPLGAGIYPASPSGSATTGHLLIFDGGATAQLSSYASRREP